MDSLRLWAVGLTLFLHGALLVARAAEPVSQERPQVLEALKRGMGRLERKEYRAAVSEFKRAGKLAGGPCGPCLLGLARAHNGAGDRKKAAEAARSAIPLINRPDALAQAYNELGVALAGNGTKSLAEAEDAFRKALELGPPSPGTVRANLAGALLGSGRHAEALELAREALSTGPPNANARIVLCHAKRVAEAPFLELAPPPVDLCSPHEGLRLTNGDLVPDEKTMSRPKKIFGEVPEVPPAVRRSAAYGMSMLSAVIDEEGCVRKLVVCEGGTEGFVEAAQEALSRWVFEPATVEGVPVSVYYTLTTRFNVYSQ
jgi:TonB family protein